MKVKFNAENYKNVYIENDIQMVEKIKETMKMKSIIVILFWYVIGLFVVFDICNAFYVKFLFSFLSILLLFLTCLSLKQYQQNKILKLLIKNYFIRAIVGILGITLNVIAIVLLGTKNVNPVLSIFIVSCVAVITLVFSYVNNSKYMEIKDTKTTTIATSIGVFVVWLIVRNFNVSMMFILGILILVIVVFSLSEHIIRSIRLLKFAPNELLDKMYSDSELCNESVDQ